MKTRSTSRASATPATPARTSAASAGRSAAILLGFLIASCQSASETRSSEPLRYSVKKNAARFVVEATLRTESHILVVYDTKWVTLTLGEAQEGSKDIEISEDAEEPVPVDVGNFSGLILAVRCRDAQSGMVDVDFRIYRAKGGRVIAKERSKGALVEGSVQEIRLP